MGRSIAEQSVAELGGTTSVLARQRRDHVELEDLLVRLDRATDGLEEQELLHRIARLVFSHAFAEETVLWPAVRRALPDGDRLTLRVEKEHQEINHLAREIARTPPEDSQRGQLVDRMVSLLRDDVRDEEDVLLPRLQHALDARDLRRLGWYWEAVRRTAPTRPHPRVARRPPGNVLAAAPLAVLDRARDALDRAARAQPGRWRTLLGSSSAVLAAVSDRVERVWVVRRGEHPSTSAD